MIIDCVADLHGHYPKIEGETAIGGFGYDKQGMSIKGRIEYAS